MGHGISGRGSRESGKKMEYRYHVWVQKFFIMGWDRDPQSNHQETNREVEMLK